MKKGFKFLAVALISSIVLTGCGGGGSSAASTASGGSSGGGTTPPSAQYVAVNTALQTPTYSSDSALKTAFFDDVNAVRKAWSISLLDQNSDLDTAAQKHAIYLSNNAAPANQDALDPTTGLLYAHSEDVSSVDFYSATPQSRANLAGYTGSVAEVASPTYNLGSGVTSNVTYGTQVFNGLMTTVYHRTLLLEDGLRDIGIGFQQPGNVVIDMGIIGTSQPLPASTLNVYPLPNSTDNFPVWTSGAEAPNPTPTIPVGTLIGGPISIAAGSGHNLTVSSFTLVDNLGNNVLVQLVDASNDSEQASVGGNFAHIIPLAPLALGRTFTATFSGAVDGVTQPAKVWSFSTPAGVISGPAQTSYTMTAGTPLTIDFTTPSGSNNINVISITGGSATGLNTNTTNSSVTITVTSVTAPVTLTLQLVDSAYNSVPAKTVTVTINP